MRIALSTLAWDAADDGAVAALMKRHEVDAIEIAFGKHFPRPSEVAADGVRAFRERWACRGAQIVAAQSLLYGAPPLNIFGSESDRRELLARLSHVCRISSGLGATRLVFGSFRNRDRGDRSETEAAAIAVSFFRALGRLADSHGLVVCLEAVPARYGANFITSTPEAAALVAAVGHAAIRLHLDTGTMAVNGEDAAWIITAYASLIGHVHASEPDLAVLGEGGADHAGIARLLSQRLPEQIVSIEMLLQDGTPRLPSIDTALTRAIHHYRG